MTISVPGRMRRSSSGRPPPTQPAADVVGERQRVVEVRAVRGEDDVGVAGGEVAALAGVAGLEDHRVALRAARQGRAEVDVEVVAADGAPVDGARRPPRRRRRSRRRRRRRASRPRWRAGHVEELLGAPVAVGVVEVAAAAEVLPGPRVVGGHHVPAGAALGEQVETGQAAGQVGGLVERGVGGGDQPDPLGAAASAASWVIASGRPATSRSWTRPVHLAQPQPLAEEERVEQAAFGGLGDLAVRLRGDLRAARRVRPDRPVVDALEEDPEVQLGVRAGDVGGVGAGHRGAPAARGVAAGGPGQAQGGAQRRAAERACGRCPRRISSGTTSRDSSGRSSSSDERMQPDAVDDPGDLVEQGDESGRVADVAQPSAIGPGPVGVEVGDPFGGRAVGGVEGDLDLGEGPRARPGTAARWPRSRRGAARDEGHVDVLGRHEVRAAEHDELPLRRARHDRRTLHGVGLTGEVDGVEPVAVEIAAGGDVTDDGVVLPRIPQRADDLDRVGRLAAQSRRRRRRADDPRWRRRRRRRARRRPPTRRARRRCGRARPAATRHGTVRRTWSTRPGRPRARWSPRRRTRPARSRRSGRRCRARSPGGSDLVVQGEQGEPGAFDQLARRGAAVAGRAARRGGGRRGARPRGGRRRRRSRGPGRTDVCVTWGLLGQAAV